VLESLGENGHERVCLGKPKVVRENLDQIRRGHAEFVQKRALVLVARLRDELLFLRLFSSVDEIERLR
jgi:hypothetical protein